MRAASFAAASASAALFALLAGCAALQAQMTLVQGLREYDAGDYAESSKTLQRALDIGLFSIDSGNAHKHLAFIHCASNRERQCREEFRKVLELDPRFELDKSEAGHPIWGPVFRSVRSKK